MYSRDHEHGGKCSDTYMFIVKLKVDRLTIQGKIVLSLKSLVQNE